MANFSLLLKKMNIEVHDSKLYELAFTHPSYNADANTKHNDYEKLEYMGDAVLDFVSADLIFKLHPEMNQGDLSKLRGYLVQTKSLAKYARKINIASYIKSGHSLNIETINKSEKILENVFEALIGAIYLDNGIDAAYRFIEYFIKDDALEINRDDLTDAKTKLQEEMQSEYRTSVHYEVVSTEGPAHDRTFTVNVMFNDIVLATGTGKSKKKAEEDAAKKALAKRSV